MSKSPIQKVLEAFGEDATLASMRVLGRRTIGDNKTYGEASGKLRESLTYDVVKKKDIYAVRFGSPLPQGDFIYFGVNGTHKNQGSPFSYGTKQPPTKAIREWMRVKPVRMRSDSGQFVTQNESAMNGIAYVIARSIKKYGIASLKYWDIGIDQVLPKWEDKIMSAMLDEFHDGLQDEDPNFK